MTRLSRRAVMGAAAAALAPRTGFSEPASVLRVGMTLADIPLTTGQASQGGEGQRFIGLTLYDALINWDLSHADRAAPLQPGLATSWSVDPETKTVWTFHLRSGVKFHDGSSFNAESVIWNLDKLMKKTSPQYDQAQVTQSGPWIGTTASYRALDDMTVQIVTTLPDAVFPYQVVNISMSSPTRWKELGGDWSKVAEHPSGTGPWILEKAVPRDRAELRRNAGYWDPGRVPKSEHMILRCIPDSTTRLSALLSGQVDWIEAPPPDAVSQIRSAGMQVVTNVYPHIWPYQLSFLPESPFRDIRIRKAANLAIDRDGLVKLLGGLALPAKGMVTPGHPWFGKPTFDIKYDPDTAKALLKDAGYSPDKPVKAKFLISTSGSGQMQPLPMNEFIQENLKEVGIEVSFDTMDWEALRARRRGGVEASDNKGADGINNSWSFTDPDIGLIGTAWSKKRPPGGYNWGGFSDAEADDLAARAKVEFDPAKQNELLAQLHARMVDQAMWIWVVHDLNPRALGANVKGYVEAQSWFQDLTPVSVG
jgi:ABC-type transport system substrate-binding protein